MACAHKLLIFQLLFILDVHFFQKLSLIKSVLFWYLKVKLSNLLINE